MREKEESGTGTTPHIGTLNEKPLHAALKTWCSEPGDRFEVPVSGFVADIARGTALIEVQTGSTSGLRRKLVTLLRRHEVRLVLPVAARKTIARVDALGRTVSERTSSRRAGVLDAFRQMVSLGDLVADSNLTLDVILIHEREVRLVQPPSCRRVRAAGERQLVEVLDCISLRHPADFLAVLPATLPSPFTTADLAAAVRQPRWMAQKIAYVLRTIGVLAVVGKRGNALLYERESRP